jgi:hypothetical protein
MKTFFEELMKPSHRRLMAFLLAFFALSLNGPLRLGLDKDHAAILAALCSGYIGQSTVKDLVSGAAKKQQTKDGQ